MSEKYVIYSIHHKAEKYPAYQNSIVKPIFAGEKDPNRTDIKLSDADGDKQIANLNHTFSEFTATYWGWKNSDAEYIGIMHYRRALNFSFESQPSECGFCQAHGLTRSRLDEVFKEADIVVGEPMHFSTIFEQYKSCHQFLAEDVFQDIKYYLSKEYPDMVSSFNEHFHGRNQNAYFKCQIVAKKEAFNDYANFIFDVLFYLNDKYKDKIKGTKWEARYFAFIGERLMSLFIYHVIKKEKYKVKCYPISMYDSLENYNNYYSILLSEYKQRAAKSEPEKYLRHLFFHQNEADSSDKRVSLNINYIDNNGLEYSGVIVKNAFEKYILNSSQKKESCNSLKIIGRDNKNQELIIGSDLQFCTSDRSQKDGISYMTSGSRDYYKAYMINWNEANFNYCPLDRSLTKQYIFVFNRPGSKKYTASSRLYLCANDSSDKKYFYIECRYGEKSLDVYYSVENSCEPKYFVSNSVTCLDKDNQQIKLSINNNGIIIDDKSICDCITVPDWNGDIFEVHLAKWFYFPYPFFN